MLRQANEAGLTSLHLHPVEQAEYQRVTTVLASAVMVAAASSRRVDAKIGHYRRRSPATTASFPQQRFRRRARRLRGQLNHPIRA